MKQYRTFTFKDTSWDRGRMERMIEEQSREGWQLVSQQVLPQGYSFSKTVFLGFLFLPLALLGKKQNIILVTMSKDVTEKELQEEEQREEALHPHTTMNKATFWKIILLAISPIGIFLVYIILKPILGLILFLSFLLFVLGMIKPSLLRFLFRKTVSRKKIAVILGIATIVLFLMFSLSLNYDATKTTVKNVETNKAK